MLNKTQKTLILWEGAFSICLGPGWVMWPAVGNQETESHSSRPDRLPKQEEIWGRWAWCCFLYSFSNSLSCRILCGMLLNSPSLDVEFPSSPFLVFETLDHIDPSGFLMRSLFPCFLSILFSMFFGNFWSCFLGVFPPNVEHIGYSLHFLDDKSDHFHHWALARHAGDPG